MPISTTGFAHVRLTVTDIARSRSFYDDVFAFPVAFEVPANADHATREALDFLYGGVIYQVGSSVFGLRPVAPETDHFDENRVGLDHISFSVGSHADLAAAVKVLDDSGISHGGIKDIGAGFILEFRDPDGIALEVFAPTESSQRQPTRPEPYLEYSHDGTSRMGPAFEEAVQQLQTFPGFGATAAGAIVSQIEVPRTSSLTTA